MEISAFAFADKPSATHGRRKGIRAQFAQTESASPFDKLRVRLFFYPHPEPVEG
jgi:hypothetical protein